MVAEIMIPLTKLPPAPQQKADPPEVFSNKAEDYVAAQVKLVDEMNSGIIPAHNSLVNPVNQVLANLSHIAAVANISKNVVSVANISTNVVSVDGVKAQVVRTAQSADKIDRVHASIANIDRVYTSVDPVDTVSEQIANVNTVASIASAVVDLSADHAMFARVDLQAPMLNRVDAISTSVESVAAIDNQVVAVEEKIPVIQAVHDAISSVQNVEENLARIVAVENTKEAIELAAFHIKTIDAVGANIQYIDEVATHLPTIVSINSDLPHIRTVAQHTTNIDTVGRNIACVQEVDRRMQLVIDAPHNATAAAAAASESAKQAALAKEYANSASAVTGLPVATDQNDMQPVIWNKDKQKFDFGAPAGVNLLPAPAITVAAQMPAGFNSPLMLTGLVGLVGTTVNTFQLQVNDSAIQDLTAIDGAYTGVITAQGAHGTVWTLKARAIDSMGNTSLWNQVTATLVHPFVNRPNVTSPLSGGIVSNKTIALTSSPFGSTHLTDTHASSRWILSTDEAGNNIIHDSGWLSDSLTSYVATIDPVAATNSILYAHVQHEGILIGQSEKSPAVPLKTSYVLKPSITSPLLSSMVSMRSVHMSCSDFATYAGNFDTHTETRWRVTTDATGNNALADSGWQSTNMTSYTAALSPMAVSGSNLYLWVEHRGELLGDSTKSTGVCVVVGNLQKPTIISPNESSGILVPTFTVTGSPCVATGFSDTLKAVTIQVAKDIAFTHKIYDQRVVTTSTSRSVTISPQVGNPPLYVRIMYEGDALGTSEWSDAVQMTVGTINNPMLTSPAAGATVFNSVTIVTSAFSVPSGVSDTHASTDWKITSDAEGAYIVMQALNSPNKTSHTFSNFTFTMGNTYYLWARHNGTTYGTGQWSKGRAVVLKQGVITPGGRILYRHASNKGTVMEFNDGKPRSVLVLDAQYRDKRVWGAYNYDMPSLTNYTTMNSRNDWFLNTSNGPNINAATAMTDAQVNALWVNSIDANTSRQNCDLWMSRNEQSDAQGISGVPAVAYARSVTVDGKPCDVPNIQTLMRVFLEANELDNLDPTVATNKTKAFGVQNSIGFWDSMGTATTCSSTEQGNYSVRRVFGYGLCSATHKNGECYVVLVQEL